MGHDPKLIESLRMLKAKLEAMPEELRGPFLVKGLAPYVAPATNPKAGQPATEVVRKLRRWSNNPYMLASAEPVLAEAADLITALEADNKRLREALEPFASESLFAGPQHEFVTVKVSDCDRARAALQPQEASKP